MTKAEAIEKLNREHDYWAKKAKSCRESNLPYDEADGMCEAYRRAISIVESINSI